MTSTERLRFERNIMPWYKAVLPHKIKADRPHPRNYPHTPTDDRHTYQHLRLAIALIALYWSNGSAWGRTQMDRRTDRRMDATKYIISLALRSIKMEKGNKKKNCGCGTFGDTGQNEKKIQCWKIFSLEFTPLSSLFLPASAAFKASFTIWASSLYSLLPLNKHK